MAYIVQLPGGSWRIRWRESGKLQGATYPSQRKALGALPRYEAREGAAGKRATGAELSLLEIVERWEKAKLAAGKDPLHTARDAQTIRTAFKRAGWERCRDITPEQVEIWKHSGSPRTGAKMRAVLRWARVILDQVVSDRVLDLFSPAGAKRRPKRGLLTDAKVEGFMAKAEAIGPEAHALLHCLVSYGWRPITAARMLVGDVNQSAMTLDCRVKGGDVVRHPILPATVALLWPLVNGREAKAPLFTDPRSKGLPWALVGSRSIPQWFADSIVKNRRQNPERIYDLKRYAITRMLRRGMKREQVVVFTGHRVLAQIDTYVVHNDDSNAEALAALAAVAQSGARNAPMGAKVQ